MITSQKLDNGNYAFTHDTISSNLTIHSESPAHDDLAIMYAIMLGHYFQEPVNIKNFPAPHSKIEYWSSFVENDISVAYNKKVLPETLPLPSIIISGNTRKETPLSNFFDTTAAKHTIKDTYAIPFSFGKESLLTYFMLKELNQKIQLYNVIYPSRLQAACSTSIKKFDLPVTKRFINIKFFNHLTNPPQKISSIMESYFMSVMAIMGINGNTHRVLLGNEDSTDVFENYHNQKYYPVYDQTSENTLKLSNYLSSNYGTTCNSLLYPLHETAILKILHTRYDSNYIKTIQTSCHRATYQSQHCGICSKCGRIYAILTGLGFDVSSMFRTNPFDTLSNYPFMQRSDDEYSIDVLHSDEIQLGLLNATDNGHKGIVIDTFKENFYDKAEKHRTDWNKKYLAINTSKIHTIPEELRDNILAIFKEELK